MSILLINLLATRVYKVIVGAGPSQSGCTLAINIGGKVFRASNKELVKGLIDSGRL